jgi:hypothetical protein
MKKIVNGEVLDMTQEEIDEYLAWSKQNIENSKVEAVRDNRNALLAGTDWTQGADVPSIIKDSYAVYRQALRDVPEQESFPNDIIWPTKPE